MAFSCDKGPRIEQRYYMYKDCKNECKLENLKTAGLAYWSLYEIDIQCDSKGFTALSGHSLEQLDVCMEKPDTFQDREDLCAP